MARPPKLNQMLIDNAKYYLDNYNQEPFNDLFPMVEGMALHVGTARETLHAWARGDLPEDCEELGDKFSHIFEQMMSKQAKIIINGSITNDLNSTMSKLMLTKHGYTDKVGTDITSGGEKIANVWNLTGVKPDAAN